MLFCLPIRVKLKIQSISQFPSRSWCSQQPYHSFTDETKSRTNPPPSRIQTRMTSSASLPLELRWP